jgi:hypothetical protein
VVTFIAALSRTLLLFAILDALKSGRFIAVKSLITTIGACFVRGTIRDAFLCGFIAVFAFAAVRRTLFFGSIVSDARLRGFVAVFAFAAALGRALIFRTRCSICHANIPGRFITMETGITAVGTNLITAIIFASG